MAYEIDYIPVGEGERSGDCIALRFWNDQQGPSSQTVIVIDGGFKESGEKLVEHIKSIYGTETVDLVISTHPDADHASGLSVVLEKLKVKQLAMHRPWEHASEIKDYFKNKRITVSGLEDRLEKALQNASDLEDLALNREIPIPIVEPFQGIKGFNGVVHVLGPSKDYYETLLASFRSTPEPKKSIGLLSGLSKAVESVKNLIQDFMHIDLLDDDEDTTSAENNTSTIILFEIEGHKLLFTGDAGKTALSNAITYAESNGISLVGMRFIDVPHHGSKRNLSSKILKKMNAENAFISAATKDKKHPAKKITNALQKHGSKVYVTQTDTLCHNFNGINRGWGPAPTVPFHQYVEE